MTIYKSSKIYCTTNDINNYKYIGSTSKRILNDRLFLHLCDSTKPPSYNTDTKFQSDTTREGKRLCLGIGRLRESLAHIPFGWHVCACSNHTIPMSSGAALKLAT